jgi:hypothetical protein
MASLRKWRCESCNAESKANNLFDALMAISTHSHSNCDKCGNGLSLKITFPFGLNAEHNTFIVRHAYSPSKPESWTDESGHTVLFYPFLVVGDRPGRASAIWLPYWQLHKTPQKDKKKYGQWAPFMDTRLFNDLLAQAHKEHILTPSNLPYL